ncbi:hypothetical protein COCVIDRAFT_33856 [Bipolaris victoriae FI3]|uniref:Uncharacterized protein n=2 Tax=Bipolaris TaxID=33194 RepID=W6Y3J1_COCC2|nr:uncharacterized protein COCCADRAFT_37795 [Bipolaris zeicola 26-R-13]XP_014561159.1 hypothetical protein COCVIDRAFT_33856 [Bipolaris victoriae FI3]EUC32200.1 hypothetical protein COCCADRAFT_37795 [Bipolaris zeicola 26-R-13]
MVKEAERRGEQRLDDCAFLSSPVLPSSWWWCDSPCGYSREDPQLDDCAHSLLAIFSFAPITRPGLRGPGAWEVVLSIACAMAGGGGGATPCSPDRLRRCHQGSGKREVRNAGEWSGQGMAWSRT